MTYIHTVYVHIYSVYICHTVGLFDVLSHSSASEIVHIFFKKQRPRAQTVYV